MSTFGSSGPGGPPDAAAGAALDRPLLIAVEGPIGVGKTALAKRLAQHLNFRPVLEIPQANPYLSRFYHRRKENAFRTQMAFLIDRFKMLSALGQGELFTQGVLTDFTLYKDRIYAALNLDPEEFRLYTHMFEALRGYCHAPDAIVFMRADSRALHQAVMRRKLVHESNIEGAYVTGLCEAYQQWADHDAPAPIVTVHVDPLAQKPPGQEAFLTVVDSLRKAVATGTAQTANAGGDFFRL
ncbi:MAG: deoxynucleoside kinase [Planctomycetota bacterium]